MSNTRTVNLEHILTSLAGRTTLIILTQMVIAASLSLIYLYFLDIGFKMITLLVQTGLGITSALFARILLGKQSRSLQLSAALTAMIAGQTVLNFISKGVLGLPFLRTEINGPYWGQMAQVFWSGVMTSLVTYAWNGKKQIRKQAVLTDDQSKADNERSSHQNHRKSDEPIPIMNNYFVNSSNVKFSTPINKYGQLKKTELKASHSDLTKLPGELDRTLESQKITLNKIYPKLTSLNRIEEITKIAWKKARNFPEKIRIFFTKMKKDFSSHFSLVRQKNEQLDRTRKTIRFSLINIGNSHDHKIFLTKRSTKVKLVGEEEHICPYCLEPVTRHDHRGMKICPICKTWHHLDCWTEVGECQVAHYQK